MQAIFPKLNESTQLRRKRTRDENVEYFSEQRI